MRSTVHYDKAGSSDELSLHDEQILRWATVRETSAVERWPIRRVNHVRGGIGAVSEEAEQADTSTLQTRNENHFAVNTAEVG